MNLTQRRACRNIIHKAAIKFGTDSIAICGRSRTAKTVEARDYVIFTINKKINISKATIGEIFGIKISAVNYSLRRSTK